MNEILTYKCQTCDRVATLKCNKTSEFFCSLKCNQLKKEPVVPVEKNQIIFGEDIKVKDKVVISAVINERCLFLRPASVDEAVIMNSVLKLSKDLKKLEKLPEVDDLVVVNFLNDFYRAKVLVLKEDAVSVQLIDFGGTASVQLCDIWEITEECQRLKCDAHRVFLKNIKNSAINQNIIDYVLLLLEQESELLVNAIDGEEIILNHDSTMKTVNDMLNDLSIVEDANYDNSGVLYDDVS